MLILDAASDLQEKTCYDFKLKYILTKIYLFCKKRKNKIQKT